MDEWPLRTIGDLVTLQRGIDLPSQVRNDGQIPIMGSFGVTGYHDEAACSGPGVTVGRSGASIGSMSYVECDYWPLNTCLYVRDFHGNNPRFAFYFLQTIDLAGMNSGSAQPSLNRNFVHPFPVRFPGRAEQDSIAKLLGALDDKIELNRRMNDTLEAQARALFRDWFVDFGPVKAKMAGDAPYLAPELWSLFPDRLDDDGVPDGWRTYCVDEIADHHTRSTKPMDAPSELFEHFSLPAYDDGQQPVLEPGERIKSNKTIVPEGAILLSKLNPDIPRVWWPNAAAEHRQIASTEFIAFTAKPGFFPALLYSLFSDDTFRQRLEGMVTGTSKSHQRVSPPALRSLEALAGNGEVFAALGEIATSFMRKVLANRAENLSLAATRDLLLPKLMSGEIRVGEAEREVEEVL